jgi:hypothetical protein
LRGRGRPVPGAGVARQRAALEAGADAALARALGAPPPLDAWYWELYRNDDSDEAIVWVRVVLPAEARRAAIAALR